MRALLPLVVGFVLLAHSFAADTAKELSAQLLHQLAIEETAALKRSDSNRAAVAKNAGEALRQALSEDRSRSHEWRSSDHNIPRLKGLLAEFPELTKRAEAWEQACLKEDEQWEKEAIAEMEKAAHAAVVKVRAVQRAADLDEPISQLLLLLGKYPYDRSASIWPSWVSCARAVSDLQSFTSALQGVFVAEEAGQQAEALTQLRYLFRCEEVIFLPGTELRAIRNARARALGLPSTDEAEQAVRALIAKAIAATQPAELDPLLEQINRCRALWIDIRSHDPESHELERLNNLGREFVAKWQDYLVKHANHADDAWLTVSFLADTAKGEPIYPRSKLLEILASMRATEAADPEAKKTPETKAEELLASVKTLEDLDAQIVKLRGTGPRAGVEQYALIQEIQRMREALALLGTGNLEDAAKANSAGFSKLPKLIELHAQLTIRILAKALNAEPQAGESAGDFIMRLAADARQRKDWHRLRDVLETPSRFLRPGPLVTVGDRSAVRSFLAARNLDEAGVWPAAVTAYIQALKNAATFLPVGEIKERLEAIRREHPDDYQRGSDQAAVSAPAPAR